MRMQLIRGWNCLYCKNLYHRGEGVAGYYCSKQFGIIKYKNHFFCRTIEGNDGYYSRAHVMQCEEYDSRFKDLEEGERFTDKSDIYRDGLINEKEIEEREKLRDIIATEIQADIRVGVYRNHE